jgi:hypothetical protein
MSERKKIIQNFDNERKKNEQLDEIDQYAKEDAEYLLKKANHLRQEQEDEVKRLNEVNIVLVNSCSYLVYLFLLF